MPSLLVPEMGVLLSISSHSSADSALLEFPYLLLKSTMRFKKYLLSFMLYFQVFFMSCSVILEFQISRE